MFPFSVTVSLSLPPMLISTMQATRAHRGHILTPSLPVYRVRVESELCAVSTLSSTSLPACLRVSVLTFFRPSFHPSIPPYLPIDPSFPYVPALTYFPLHTVQPIWCKPWLLFPPTLQAIAALGGHQRFRQRLLPHRTVTPALTTLRAPHWPKPGRTAEPMQSAEVSLCTPMATSTCAETNAGMRLTLVPLIQIKQPTHIHVFNLRAPVSESFNMAIRRSLVLERSTFRPACLCAHPNPHSHSLTHSLTLSLTQGVGRFLLDNIVVGQLSKRWKTGRLTSGCLAAPPRREWTSARQSAPHRRRALPLFGATRTVRVDGRLQPLRLRSTQMQDTIAI